MTHEEKVEAKLDSIIGLLAASVTFGKRQEDQILALARAGIRPNEMAKLIGTSSNRVNVVLSGLRKRNLL